MEASSLRKQQHRQPPTPFRASVAIAQFLYSRRPVLLLSLASFLLLGLLFPWHSVHVHTHRAALRRWENYTLVEAAAFVGNRSGTIIVCSVSLPFLPFLNNWLISVSRQRRAQEVLVVAEDHETLYNVNERWPGHAVLLSPASVPLVAHMYGSKGFFDLTNRRAGYLLQILELGYTVFFNDVDMVWLADPFPFLDGNHDVYFMDDSPMAKPLDHRQQHPAIGRTGHTNICACMLFLHPTIGSKKVLQKWVEEIQGQRWFGRQKGNDQIALNLALNKTAKQADMHLLPQAAFPSGGLYFRDGKWVEKTKGMQVVVHNNFIKGYDSKKKRFQDFGLWLADEHADESPLGKI